MPNSEGTGGKKIKSNCKGCGVSFLEGKNVQKLDGLFGDGCIILWLNIRKHTELYILNGWMVWHMNHISMKLLKNKNRINSSIYCKEKGISGWIKKQYPLFMRYLKAASKRKWLRNVASNRLCKYTWERNKKQSSEYNTIHGWTQGRKHQENKDFFSLYKMLPIYKYVV